MNKLLERIRRNALAGAIPAAVRRVGRYVGKCFLCLLALAGIAAAAEDLDVEVKRVFDGDSFLVVLATGDWREVRLAGIDAPERYQAYANVSRTNLRRLIEKQRVRAAIHKHDRHGRLVGTVMRGDEDVALAQLQAGLAWYDRRHRTELEPVVARRYADAEREARAERRGLWRHTQPMPPWEWRRLHPR